MPRFGRNFPITSPVFLEPLHIVSNTIIVNFQLVWTIRTRLNVTKTLLWNIINSSSTGSVIVKTFTLNWFITGSLRTVIKSFSLRWNILIRTIWTRIN